MHSSGMVCPSMRPIATDMQQWCGLSTWPIAIAAMGEQQGGKLIGFALHFYLLSLLFF